MAPPLEVMNKLICWIDLLFWGDSKQEFTQNVLHIFPQKMQTKFVPKIYNFQVTNSFIKIKDAVVILPSHGKKICFFLKMPLLAYLEI